MNNIGMNLLDPQLIKIYREPLQGLCFQDLKKDNIYHNIGISLLFPLTNKDSFIRLIDQKEREIGIIEDINQINDDSRQAINNELQRKYFIPKITKIHSIEEKFGTRCWQVETEKGDRSFEVKDKKNIRFINTTDNLQEVNIKEPVLFITDVDGNRYELSEISRLDRQSRKILDISV